jgi:hypothetical protein
MASIEVSSAGICAEKRGAKRAYRIVPIQIEDRAAIVKSVRNYPGAEARSWFLKTPNGVCRWATWRNAPFFHEKISFDCGERKIPADFRRTGEKRGLFSAAVAMAKPSRK